MKNKKNFLLVIITIVFSILCFNSRVYAVDCNSYKYACAKCVYVSAVQTYTFTVYSNEDGKVILENEYKKNNENNKLTYNVSSSVVVDNFISKSKKKLSCPNELNYSMSGGNSATTAVTLSFSKFSGSAKKPLKLDSSSVNNNKEISQTNAIIKSCTYSGYINANKVADVYIRLTKKGLEFEATNGYKAVNSDDANINTSTFTATTNCSDFKVHITCGTSGSNKVCSISKNDALRPGTESPGTTTDDADSIDKDQNNKKPTKPSDSFDYNSEEFDCVGLLSPELIDIMNEIITWIRIIVPVLLVVFAVVDFGPVLLSDDRDSMKKASSKFIKRCIIAVAIFLIPIVLGWLINIFNSVSDNKITDLISCGIK